MPANTLSGPNQPAREQPIAVGGELRCALTGRPLTHDEAHWAPPLVTVRELVATVASTLLRTPGALGQVLLADMPNVPYAPEARERLAARRTAEQAKLLGLLLLVCALFIVPIVLIGF